METIRRILVPTDFSDVASNALKAALFIAQQFKAEIYLAHFYLNPYLVSDLNSPLWMDDEVEHQEILEAKLGLLRQQVKAEHPTLNVFADVVMATVPDGISSLSVKNDIDLVVIGAHKADWIEKSFLGTNSTQAAKEVSVPLLVVPEKASLDKIQKIVLSTDFQLHDLDLVRKVTAFAQVFQASVKVIHLHNYSGPEVSETLEMMEEWAEKRCPDCDIAFKNKKVKAVSSEELNKVVKREKADMLVMSTCEKNVFERMLNGSFTEEMLYLSNIPILLYKIEDHYID